MQVFTRDTFDYEGFATGLGMDEGQFSELDSEQLDELYNTAARRAILPSAKLFSGANKDRQALDHTLQQYPDARASFNVPDAIDDPTPELTVENAINYVESLPNAALYRNRPVEDVVKLYADTFTKGNRAFFKYPSLRGTDTASESQVSTDIEKFIGSEFDDAGLGVSGDTPVHEALATFQKRKADAEAIAAGTVLPEEEGEEGSGAFLNAVGNLNNSFATGIAGVPRLLGSLSNTLTDHITGDLLFNNDTNELEYKSPAELTELRQSGDVTNPLTSVGNLAAEGLTVEGIEAKTKIEKLAAGGGSFAAFFLAGAAGALLKGVEGAAAISTALGIGTGTSSGYDDYLATLQETGGEFDQATLDAATQLNSLIGASEAFAPLQVLKRLSPDGKVPVGKLFELLDKHTGNAFTNALKKGVIGAGEEGLQEFVASVASNAVAKGLEYDPERGFVTDESIEGAEIGGTIGFILNAIIGGLAPKRRSRVHNQLAAQTTGEEAVAADPTDPAAPAAPTPPRQRPNAPIVQIGNDQFSVVNNRVVQGATPADVQSQFDSVERDQAAGVITHKIDEGSETQVVKKTKTTPASATVTTEQGEVLTAEGKSPKKTLTNLIGLHNNEASDVQLADGLNVIVNDDSTFTAEVGTQVATAESLADSVTQAVSQHVAGADPLAPGKANRIAFTDTNSPNTTVSVPLAKGKFKPDVVQDNLSSQGFSILSTPVSKKNRITGTQIRAYKDGLIYNVKLNKKGVKLAVTDLNGKKLKSPDVKATSANLGFREVDSSVKTKLDKEGGTTLDADELQNTADLIGATITAQDSRSAVLTKGNDSAIIQVAPAGGVTIFSDNDQFTGQIRLLDPESRDALNLKNAVEIAEVTGWKVDEVQPGQVGLTFEGSDTQGATLIQNDKGITLTTRDGAKFNKSEVTTLQEVKEIFGLDETTEAPPVTFLERTQGNQEFVDELASDQLDVMDTTEILARGREVSEGVFQYTPKLSDKPKSTILTSANETVEHVADNMLASMSSTGLNNLNEIETDKGKWNIRDLDPYIAAIPPSIRSIITLHSTQSIKQATGKGGGAWGIYEWAGPNGPQIHIDARPEVQSMQNVLDTLAHEVGHFGFDSWDIPELTHVMDTAYDILKPHIENEIPQYIRATGTNLDRPTTFQKWILVNEYFALHNSGLLDYETGNLAEFLDAGEIQRLKDEVAGGPLVRVIQQIAGKDPLNAENTKSFLENIIKLQIGATSNKRVHLTYKVSNNGKDSEVIVRTTPSGSRVDFIPDNRQSQRLAKIGHLYENRHVSPYSGLKWLYFRHMNGLWGEQLMGNSLTNLVAGGFQSFVGIRARGLQALNSDRLAVESKLLELERGNSFSQVDDIADRYTNFDPQRELDERVNFDFLVDGDGYETRLKNAGHTGNSLLKRARKVDRTLQEGGRHVNENVVEIRQRIREDQKLAVSMAQDSQAAGRGGLVGKKLTEYLEQSKQFGESIATGYRHRRYGARHADGVKGLIDIRTDFTASDKVGNAIEDRADTALNEIRALETQVTAGKLDAARAAQKMEEHVDILKLGLRKKQIQLWANRQLGGLVKRDDVNQLIVSKIDEIVTDVDRQTGHRSNDKMQLVDGVRGRRLNEDDPLDRLFMKFLDPVTNPIEVYLGTIENQNKVSHILEWGNNYARTLYQSGVARPIGTDTRRSWVADAKVGRFQEGSVLSFIEVRDFVAQEIDANIGLHDQVEQSWLDNVIAFRKKNVTINNIDLGVANAAGNVFMLGLGGHAAYLGRYMDTKGVVAEAWRDRTTLVAGKSKDTFAETIVKEMTESYTFNSGVTSLEVEVHSSDLFEKFVSAILDAPDKVGLGVRESVKQHPKEFINKVNEFLTTAYAFGDDWSKVLPYILNRELELTRAKTQIPRSKFPDTDNGTQRYNQALLDIALPKATERTHRETFIWSLTPVWAKKLARHKKNIFTSNFIMHPLQFLRIGIESHKLWADDLVAYQAASDQGHQELKQVLGGRIASRAAGLLLADTSAAMVAGGTVPLGIKGLEYMALLAGFDEQDDEDTLYGDRLDAAQDIANIVSFNGSSLYSPMPGKKNSDGSFNAVNVLRANVVHTLTPAPGPAGEFSLPHTVADFFNGFAGNSEDGGNFYRTLVRLTENPPKDRFGNTITGEQAVKDMAKEFAPLPRWIFHTPKDKIGAAIQLGETISEGYAGDLLASEDDAKAAFELIKTLGVKGARMDPDKIARTLGFQLSRDHSQFSKIPRVAETIAQLKSGDALSQDEVVMALKDITSEATRLDQTYRFNVSAFVRYGMKPNNLISNMTKNPGKGKGSNSIAPVKVTTDLVRGKDVFMDRVKKTLVKQHSDAAAALKNNKDRSRVEKLTNVEAALKLAVSKL